MHDHPLQPLLHDLVSTVRAPTTALSGTDGQIRPAGVQGLFHADARVLSQAGLLVDGREPEPVAHAVPFPGLSRFVSLARWLGDPTADPTVRIDRVRRVTPGAMDEEITVTSTAADPVTCTVTLTLACDLAPVEVVKSGRTADPLPASVTDGTLTWHSGRTRVTAHLGAENGGEGAGAPGATASMSTGVAAVAGADAGAGAGARAGQTRARARAQALTRARGQAQTRARTPMRVRALARIRALALARIRALARMRMRVRTLALARMRARARVQVRARGQTRARARAQARARARAQSRARAQAQTRAQTPARARARTWASLRARVGLCSGGGWRSRPGGP
ncbi:amylo-alpha-1,6-glucosidase [[Actinomadura] parvosata subsp. kistnae]|uniref:glycogen debranching N-terminal domain-containing protein n=1 Tax=[Actinomadura] parvosata TaxID=1955412 RepID=UPI000D2A7829|nr:amylo-alpha-1,6-glucosidase [Actinomadura parvosata subsp. kistnae]